MAESWVRHPIGLISGNQYHLGLYDECIEVQYPIRGQYCIPEFKLTAPLGKDYSFNRTENFDDYGNNHAWRTVLGVMIENNFFRKYVDENIKSGRTRKLQRR